MTSRIPGFYRLSLAERQQQLRAKAGLSEELSQVLAHGGLDPQSADVMIENVIGTYALPLSVALNFRVNERDHFVPMVVEEPSVVAAASNAAKMVRAGGGFWASCDPSWMTGQVQLVDVADPDTARLRILDAKARLLELVADAVPRLCERGGGPRDLSVRVLSRPGDPDGGMLVVHIELDCRDAMGANLVNHVAEAIADPLAELASARVGLRILTNLADRRRVHVEARVPFSALRCEATAIVAASRFAELDPYRAATHNKGIMNGVDAVLLATGNDWRSVEAGAHAYAARNGRYEPLATWSTDGDYLVGKLDMPMAVGTVGGSLRIHAGARLSLALLGVESAQTLACIVGAAGLATNLSALRALATDGIQAAHMPLHARSVARAAGIPTELLEQVAAELADTKDVSPERARDIALRLSPALFEVHE